VAGSLSPASLRQDGDQEARLKRDLAGPSAPSVERMKSATSFAMVDVVDPGLHNTNPAACVRACPIDLAEPGGRTGELRDTHRNGLARP